MSHTGWTPASIDERRTLEQARRRALVPMKYYGGMDPNMPFLDRLGESTRQALAAIPSPSYSSLGRVVPFPTDAEIEAEKEHPFAMHLPDAILFGSSVGGGIPGWVNAAKAGAGFSAIGKTQPSPTPDPTQLRRVLFSPTSGRFAAPDGVVAGSQ
jgi:hypothetical protein